MVDIIEIAKRKLENVSENQKLTEEQKQMYFGIFVNDTIENIAYEGAFLNDLLCLEK